MSRGSAHGFTLVEILVVLLIIGLVSIFAIPAVIHTYTASSIHEAARLTVAALEGARDRAKSQGKPCGIRLGMDPVLSTTILPDGTRIPPPTIAYDPNGLPSEILFSPDGSVSFPSPYGVPSMIKMGAHVYTIHLVDRGHQGYEAFVTIDIRNGRIESDVREP